METTFMTIHNLAPEANILYASDSIVDILDYLPHEVTGRSCFDYFHPDEVPFARGVHDRGVRLDKAAVLHYARIRARDGQWVSCECVFTIVYDVMVACTSIYRRGGASERRAAEAPAIRRLFTSSPRDPRYHMLEHLSAKFRAPPNPELREPRAALILNRFTRTLTVMYATNAVSSILGVSADQIRDKSFYECIQENCLPDAIRCLESAKANDSIAYLRFWYRDPRRPEDIAEEDEAMAEASQSDSDDGGVELHGRGPMDVDRSANTPVQPASASDHSGQDVSGQDSSDHAVHSTSSGSFCQVNSSSGESDIENDPNHRVFDETHGSRSSTSSVVTDLEQRRQARTNRAAANRAVVPAIGPYEIEAVISCTSDGLVVVLRRARPIIPSILMASPPHNGLFAAPWGANPIRPHVYQPNPQAPFVHGPQAPIVPAGGPNMDDFMKSIGDIAVFAWALAGINGNIPSYGHGDPRGEAQPPALPVWDPYAQPVKAYSPPENQAVRNWRQRDDEQSPDAEIQEYGLGAQAIHARQQDKGGYVYQGPGSWERNGYEAQFGRSYSAPGNMNNTPTTSAALNNGQDREIFPWQQHHEDG